MEGRRKGNLKDETNATLWAVIGEGGGVASINLIRARVRVCENVPRQFVAALVPTTLLFSGVWLIVSITRAQRAPNEKVKSVSPVGWWSIRAVSSSFFQQWYNNKYSFFSWNLSSIPTNVSIRPSSTRSCHLILHNSSSFFFFLFRRKRPSLSLSLSL